MLPESMERQAKLSYHLGLTLDRLGRSDEALAAYDRALALIKPPRKTLGFSRRDRRGVLPIETR
jgi:predicted RNA polymerase sigma factor